eukprot:CAMPEP_0181196146 /NCGR_PEP_ID=MMETSP1096-20121128/15289_1 /TAXON_ID=156174 ORGANISM="Chrysochromulina ericina, Strain CCMP281" /NCGR_SAMPLE_ID=MMETSP1096 /ASSEMBLY_ACC=CAM_ASM_000453 /LENGTH=109 /DNA_ID=CAMNT_0023285845 /DNA_START=396 /DNA_END=725 /DNA_ORIENTATION=+
MSDHLEQHLLRVCTDELCGVIPVWPSHAHLLPIPEENHAGRRDHSEIPAALMLSTRLEDEQLRERLNISSHPYRLNSDRSRHGGLRPSVREADRHQARRTNLSPVIGPQ